MRYLYLTVAILALAAVACNHYATKTYLDQINVAQRANDLDLVRIAKDENAIKFAGLVAFVANQQTQAVVKLEGKLQRATDIIKCLQADLERAKQVIIEDGETIKELTDLNSALQNGGRPNDDENVW